MPETDPLAGLVVPNKSADILSGLNIDSGYAGMDKAVKGLSSIPGLTETILPSIKALLMPGESNPAFKAIDAGTAANVAAGQTDAMRRGLTGSDIEAASMVGARNAGEMAKSNFQAQTATQLAGFIKDLATGDIAAQRENLTMFAQLMGQKITSDQDLMMFREMLSANLSEADKNRKSALWGAGIGVVGNVGASAVKYSDQRLKTDLHRIGSANGVPVFAFRWTPAAQALFGAHDQVEVGVMAQDIEISYPEAAVTRVMAGKPWLAVDYSKLPSRLVEEVNRLGATYA